MKKHSIIIVALAASLVLGACVRKVEESSASQPSAATESGQKPAEAAGAKRDDALSSEAVQKTPSTGAVAMGEEKAGEQAPSYAPGPKPAGWKSPNRIKVQHILIGVKGAPLPKPNLPSEDEARKLARELCDRIRAGEDMDALVKEYTHDSYPGIYSMIETGQPDMQNLVFPRSGMAKAFGDVSYSLDVGECAIADYDKQTNPRQSKSPFGFHVIKRLE